MTPNDLYKMLWLHREYYDLDQYVEEKRGKSAVWLEKTLDTVFPDAYVAKRKDFGIKYGQAMRIMFDHATWNITTETAVSKIWKLAYGDTP